MAEEWLVVAKVKPCVCLRATRRVHCQPANMIALRSGLVIPLASDAASPRSEQRSTRAARGLVPSHAATIVRRSGAGKCLHFLASWARWRLR